GGARARALGAELRAYLPTLSQREGELSSDDPWAGLARAEEALARGDPASALIGLSERPGKPDSELSLGWALARARVAIAVGEEKTLREVEQNLKLPPDLHPLERGRALAWRAFFGRLDGGKSQEELNRFAPGVPLAKALREEPSPWWGAANATRLALGASDQAAARATAQAGGASRGELLPSPLAALRSLAARGRDGVVGILVTRARARIESAAAGSKPDLLGEPKALLAFAAKLRPDEPLGLWARADLARAKGREIQVSAEALVSTAPTDPSALLVLARAFAAQEEALYLRWLSKQIEGREGSFATPEGVLKSFAAAAKAGGPVARTARREHLEVICRRHSTTQGEAATALRRHGLALASELLRNVDLAPVLEARGRLAKALRTGDLAGAHSAAKDMASSAARFPKGTRRALRLRSQLGDEGAPRAAQAFLALAGDLPAFAELRGRLARKKDHREARPALDALVELVPDHSGLILAREVVGLNPLADLPLGGSVDSLLSLAEVIEGAPEHTRLVLILLRGRIAQLKALDPNQIDAPGRALTTHLARALLACGQLGASGASRLKHAREALRATTAALAVDPAHPAAHLLRAEALASTPTWARKRISAEVQHSIRCARSALPWAVAPLLTELEATDPDDAGPLIDELLAQGLLTRKQLLKHVFEHETLRRHRPAAERALSSIREQLNTLVLRHALPDRVGMTGFELAVRAYSSRLPLTSLSLRLRTGADVAFDSVSKSADEFEQALAITIPADQPGQRARARAEYLHWRALQVSGDPDLRDLSDEETAERQAARTKLWSRQAAQALLEGLKDRPLGERLSLPTFMALGYRGPVEELESNSVLRDALFATQPEGREIWKAWIRRWDPVAAGVILYARFKDDAGELHPFSAEGLARPYGHGQTVLWSVQRNCAWWAWERLATPADADELILLYLRSAAFNRGATPTETLFWTVRTNFRFHGKGLDGERAALARDLFRAAQVLTGRKKFFQACEGDALVDLAIAAEGKEREAYAKEAIKLTKAIAPDAVPPHLESQGSAWWRLARARAVAGDLEGAKLAIEKIQGQGWSSWWGLDTTIGADPGAAHLETLLPSGTKLFDRYVRSEDEGDGEGEDDGEDDGEGDG
ncbi:MAG: hypothetical protein JKY65_28445, partial [Planctomycetes bacterium]|nr:hypothetical protein [Planctomycetota bacterium]